MKDLDQCSNLPQISENNELELPLKVKKFWFKKCVPSNLVLAIKDPKMFQKVVIHITKGGEMIVDLFLILQGVTFDVWQYLSSAYSNSGVYF